MPRLSATHLLLVIIGFWGAEIAWHGISWALASDLFLYGDEIGNLPGILGVHYGDLVSIFPHWLYNDRPIGVVIIRLLYDCFGLDYAKQLSAFLLLHVLNCALLFLLLRRLRVAAHLSLAAVAMFAGLCTTAQTATYVGAVYDVGCFALAMLSMVLSLSGGAYNIFFGTVLYAAAIRTKEFAILIPVVSTLLVAQSFGAGSWSSRVRRACQRLWPQYFIATVLSLQYCSLLSTFTATAGPESPYHLQFSPKLVIASLTYYTSLVVGADGEGGAFYYLPAVAALLIAVYSFLRREEATLALLAGYVATLFPVCFLPNMRSPFYDYFPQALLIAATCTFLQFRIDAAFGKSGRLVAATASAVLLLTFATVHQQSAYFRNRVNFTTAVRRANMKSAVDAREKLQPIPSGAHFFVMHESERPWLLAVGSCDYLKVISHRRDLVCTWDAAPGQIASSFESSATPKYLLQYHNDGSFKVVALAVSQRD